MDAGAQLTPPNYIAEYLVRLGQLTRDRIAAAGFAKPFGGLAGPRVKWE
jgi:hypothetical protein